VNTYKAYRSDLLWCRPRLKKHYVRELSRQDAIALVARGREELIEGKPTSQRTINKHVMVFLMAMRNQGATIQFNKGDWRC
jgi:hypothetical protein